MKEVVKSTLFYFLIGATVTGSVYKIIDNQQSESILKLLSFNLLMLSVAFLLSYFGYRTQQKKNNEN